ncbi:MAG: co-chaperone GroES family protein [Pseudomonadota bacterium]
MGAILRQAMSGKKIRHIMPVGPRVLVKVLHEEDIADSGLYLPAGAKERMQEALYGEVVEVARASPENPQEDGFGSNVSGIPHGAKVLFSKNAGTKVPWNEDLRVLETKEVLATVEVIPEESLL